MGIACKFIWQNVAGKERSEETEKFLSGMKNEFPRVFSEGLGQYTKTEVRFELNDNIRSVFKAKMNVPFTTLDSVNQELERSEKMGVISKVDYSDWATPTVYVKKKNKKIRVSADFSTWLDNCFKDHTYPYLHRNIFSLS